MARIVMCEEMTEGIVEGVNIPVLGVGVEADSFEEAHELACQRYHQWLRDNSPLGTVMRDDDDDDYDYDDDYEDDDDDEKNWWE